MMESFAVEKAGCSNELFPRRSRESLRADTVESVRTRESSRARESGRAGRTMESGIWRSSRADACGPMMAAASESATERYCKNFLKFGYFLLLLCKI